MGRVLLRKCYLSLRILTCRSNSICYPGNMRWGALAKMESLKIWLMRSHPERLRTVWKAENKKAAGVGGFSGLYCYCSVLCHRCHRRFEWTVRPYLIVFIGLSWPLIRNNQWWRLSFLLWVKEPQALCYCCWCAFPKLSSFASLLFLFMDTCLILFI